MTAYDDALKSGNPRIGIFFRLGIEPPARLWLGVGEIEAGIDAEDGNGEIYSGLGQIINMPAFNQLINGAAERVDLKLSGIDATMLALSAAGADEVKGVALLVGIGIFDADWQMVGNPTWIRRLTVDYLSVEKQTVEDGFVHTVSLSARSAMTGRRRPALSYYTDAEQQARSPGDRFCERTGLYSQEVVKTFPRFT